MAKNRIHSVLTALPALMLMIGLYYYYQSERAQLNGPLIIEEAVTLAGEYNGMSELRSGGEGQHFLWLDTSARRRGVRVTGEQSWRLKQLENPLNAGDVLSVTIAPTVSGSKTLWVVEVVRNGQVLLVRTD